MRKRSYGTPKFSITAANDGNAEIISVAVFPQCLEGRLPRRPFEFNFRG